MAKQYGSYLGGFSGRLGPAIGYMWNGRWCVRSCPAHVNNPRTAAQTEHRTAFREQVQLASRMGWAVGQGLAVPAREAGMTAYNLFVHLNQGCFAMREGRLEVDWSGLQLSAGEVSPVEMEEAVVESGNVLKVKFRKNPQHRVTDAFDRVWLYVYDAESGTNWMAAPVYRRDRRIAVALPDGMAGREVHLYLMVEDASGRWSETAYGGAIDIVDGAVFVANGSDGGTEESDEALCVRDISTPEAATAAGGRQERQGGAWGREVDK